MKKSYVLFGLIALFVFYAGWAFADSITPYVDIAEARSAHGSVQVKGLLDPDAPAPAQKGKDFVFGLVDESGEKMEVHSARRITSSPSARTRTARSRRIGCSSSVRRSMRR